MRRRRFNKRERAALYLAADGRCARCGALLEGGWHADHEIAYSDGGPTDVINGQAFCPKCNREKGVRTDMLTRQWQQRALDEYLAAGKRDFLLEATPGAGKTRLALAIARQLIDDRTVQRVAVVVPTDALRLQWSDVTGPINLRPLEDGIVEKSGYDGVVLTYAQLARGASADLIRRATARPTLAILDEIHHAGENRAWADGLEYAFEYAPKRLAMTGTPWRASNDRIPFVEYKDNLVKVQYHYRYGAAVNDDVCRPILFHAYTGEAKWVDCGQVFRANVGEELDDERAGAALDVLYDPTQVWLPGMLRKATAALDAMRIGVPDAAGLVWAETQWHAREYAKMLQQITGVAPTVVISEDKDAKDKLDSFRSGVGTWLVAVRMVSEGIDIPRLSVGVYAAKARTPLFFRQAVGRLVRHRDGEEHNAEMFIPAVPVIVQHAYEVEQELLHLVAEVKEQNERAKKETEGRQDVFNLRIPLATSEPSFDQAIHRGLGYEQADYSESLAACDRHGIPRNFAPNLAACLREMRPAEVMAQVTVQPQSRVEPQHRVEKQVRLRLQRLASQVDHREGRDPGSTNDEILRAGFPPRKQCSLDDLENIEEYLIERLRDV